ncbi:MAG: YkgJ family cysteine cluster protein [Roseburia sp.]
MQRDLTEISDGKIYGWNDMVRVSCNDCTGCSSCCEDMEDTVRLDPYDAFSLTKGLGKSFEQLLQKNVELGVEEGMILPHLKTAGKCTFLNEEGRCSIHQFRPGICRLFPLGRIYEGGKVNYILQVGECKKENRSKVKVGKWLNIPDREKYEAFTLAWYRLRKEAEDVIAKQQDTELVKTLNMFLLHNFYLKPYETEQDFYSQFETRLQQAYQILRA